MADNAPYGSHITDIAAALADISYRLNTTRLRPGNARQRLDATRYNNPVLTSTDPAVIVSVDDHLTAVATALDNAAHGPDRHARIDPYFAARAALAVRLLRVGANPTLADRLDGPLPAVTSARIAAAEALVRLAVAAPQSARRRQLSVATSVLNEQELARLGGAELTSFDRAAVTAAETGDYTAHVGAAVDMLLCAHAGILPGGPYLTGGDYRGPLTADYLTTIKDDYSTDPATLPQILIGLDDLDDYLQGLRYGHDPTFPALVDEFANTAATNLTTVVFAQLGTAARDPAVAFAEDPVLRRVLTEVDLLMIGVATPGAACRVTDTARYSAGIGEAADNALTVLSSSHARAALPTGTDPAATTGRGEWGAVFHRTVSVVTAAVRDVAGPAIESRLWAVCETVRASTEVAAQVLHDLAELTEQDQSVASDLVEDTTVIASAITPDTASPTGTLVPPDNRAGHTEPSPLTPASSPAAAL